MTSESSYEVDKQVLAIVGYARRKGDRDMIAEEVEQGVLGKVVEPSVGVQLVEQVVDHLLAAGHEEGERYDPREFRTRLREAVTTHLTGLREQVKQGSTDRAMLSTELADAIGVDPNLPKHVLLKVVREHWRRATGKAPVKKRGDFVTVREIQVAIGETGKEMSKAELLDLLATARRSIGS